MNNCYDIYAPKHLVKLLFSEFLSVFVPPRFLIAGVGGGEGVRHTVSPLSVRPSVPYVTQMVSVRYLLKRLVYWIEILYTGG